ncbi:hypothetical protein M5K25_001851 [Dendrobium thyrsiflorum]|uniref:Uncharacterized protein n=1 Tax=Dendrobium thyrsiflorum TaxID=117978 RepID=A0ABD0VZS9_DENTH
MQTTKNFHLILSDLNISEPSVLLMEPLRSTASLKKPSIEENDELVSFPTKAEQWILKVRKPLPEIGTTSTGGVLLHLAFLPPHRQQPRIRQDGRIRTGWVRYLIFEGPGFADSEALGFEDFEVLGGFYMLLMVLAAGFAGCEDWDGYHLVLPGVYACLLSGVLDGYPYGLLEYRLVLCCKVVFFEDSSVPS